MEQRLDLFSYYLPQKQTPKNIEIALGITLKKGIEATYYAELEHGLLTYTHFNVISLINFSHVQIIQTLQSLGIQDAQQFKKQGLFQDYPILIDPDLSSYAAIEHDLIHLKSYTTIGLLIVAHVVSQSVALEFYEQKLSDYYERSRKLIDASDTYSIFKRTGLSRFAKQLVMVRHDLLIELHLLDKPDILWDNPDVEMLYNRLAASLELKTRFDIVEYKLNSIKDDMVMVMDLTNHNHSAFLEWVIIILIGVEIIMGIYEWFK